MNDRSISNCKFNINKSFVKHGFTIVNRYMYVCDLKKKSDPAKQSCFKYLVKSDFV